MDDRQQASFVNKYGEMFTMTAKANANFAILTSSDSLMAEQSYCVVGGVVTGCNVSKEEADWIEQTWNEFAKTNIHLAGMDSYLLNLFVRGCVDELFGNPGIIREGVARFAKFATDLLKWSGGKK